MFILNEKQDIFVTTFTTLTKISFHHVNSTKICIFDLCELFKNRIISFFFHHSSIDNSNLDRSFDFAQSLFFLDVVVFVIKMIS